MEFEIINPSDPYTITAPDLEIAAAAVVLLGNGKYSLEGKDGTPDVPFFLFGGHDEWFQEKFDRSLNESIEWILGSRAEELAACLDSVKIGSAERSSMNDIGGRAKAIAANIRKRKETEAQV